MRIRAIDTFRGLSIVLMVFFSLLARLSNRLPDVLLHNEPYSLHLGDFVLPMFLFASGMSLVYFAKKREKKDKVDYALDIVERFGKLMLISLFLTPFSAGGFLHMDVVMLSAVLFLVTMMLIGLSETVIAGVGICVFLLYIALQQMFMLPDFTEYHLGGYPAALFYLPVMLAGTIAGKRMDEIKKLLVGAAILAVLLLLATPPHKMSASPSFMMLSVVLSLAVFAIARNLEVKQLDYLGKRPLRYWVLMFAILFIPLTFWAAYSGIASIPLGLDWISAVVLSAMGVVLLFIISKTLDLLQGKIMKMRAVS